MQPETARITADTSDAVAELGQSIATHAADGDWESVEACALKLRAAVMEIPAEDRKEALLAARRSIEAVQSLAEEAREQVAGRLSTLRRGKEMTVAYGASD